MILIPTRSQRSQGAGQVLTEAEVAFGGLDGSVSKRESDLLQSGLSAVGGRKCGGVVRTPVPRSDIN